LCVSVAGEPDAPANVQIRNLSLSHLRLMPWVVYSSTQYQGLIVSDGLAAVTMKAVSSITQKTSKQVLFFVIPGQPGILFDFSLSWRRTVKSFSFFSLLFFSYSVIDGGANLNSDWGTLVP